MSLQLPYLPRDCVENLLMSKLPDVEINLLTWIDDIQIFILKFEYTTSCSSATDADLHITHQLKKREVGLTDAKLSRNVASNRILDAILKIILSV